MRVAVVAAEMEGQPTGVGRFLSGLLDGVRALPLDWEWRLFFQGGPFNHPLLEDSRFVPEFCDHAGSGVVWEQLRLPSILRSSRPDVVYSPGYSLPPRLSAPGVVSIHDLSFECLPEEFRWRERWRRRFLARQAARRAARVLVDSGLVRDQLADLYGLDRARIAIVPMAVDPQFAASRASSDAGGDGLERLGVREPFLVTVGTLLERRCTPLLLEVFAVLSKDRPELQLVVAGANRLRRPHRLDQWIARSGLADRVRLLGFVEDALLPSLYRRAELSFYLSTYEGFGIPPLESLACGTPAVVGSGLGLDDLWPDYPYRSPRVALVDVVAAARRALDDPDLRARTMERAGQLVEALTWEASARSFVGELETAARP